MAAKRREPLDPDTLTPLEGVYGRRQVRQLESFLGQLRTRERVGAHGNRQLFLSDLFVAQLLAFHHPVVRSLRMLETLSTTPVAQHVLQCERLPRSTVSDANKVVDPQLLQPLLADLVQRVDGCELPQQLDLLVKRLVAVDGTFLRVVTELLWTLRQRTDNNPTPTPLAPSPSESWSRSGTLPPSHSSPPHQSVHAPLTRPPNVPPARPFSAHHR